MSKQQAMELGLREIDLEKTKERVEGRLDACRLYMQIGYHPGKEVSVTAGYSDTPPSATNAFHSSTESAASQNVDEEQRRRDLVESTIWAVNRLSKQEAEIIKRRYLEHDDELDYMVYNDMHMSQRKYYRLKSRAFYKIALALRIEVFVDEQAAV